MIKTDFRTAWVLVVVTLGLIGYDIYAMKSLPSGTISEVILAYSKQYTALPFAFGVLMGHWFWPQQLVRDENAE